MVRTRRRSAVILIVVGASLIALGVLLYVARGAWMPALFAPRDSPLAESTVQPSVQVVARQLDTPWALVKLPGGDLLVSQRGGQLQRVAERGAAISVADVVETSEGGLLGMALHPDFTENHFLYAYYTTQQGGKLTNRVDRYTFDNDRLSQRQTILDGVPAADNHNGGMIAFGPDAKLYVTTGDAGQSELAQDKSSLAGKILRINDDGTAPADNPFGSLIWSYGHRNPQGLAWDDRGRLWSTEHGPSGAATGRDELNIIEKGANYGWPIITGDETQSGMKTPVKQSGDDDTWAPAGLAYYDGALYFAGLRGQALYQARLGAGATVSMSQLLSSQYGRLRVVVADADGVFVGTSNRDGRGTPRDSDDQIMKLAL